MASALDFMQHTYGIFGFNFELDLSTRCVVGVAATEAAFGGDCTITFALVDWHHLTAVNLTSMLRPAAIQP